MNLPSIVDARADGAGITWGGSVERRNGLTRVAKRAKDPDFLVPSNGVFRWWCPKCHKTPRLREDRVAQLIDVFRATRGDDCDFIDVSSLYA